MNRSLSHIILEYAADVQVAGVRAGSIGAFLMLVFTLIPFIVATVLNPIDAVRLNLKLMGQPVPYHVTAQQLHGALVGTLFLLASIALLQTVLSVAFYRRSHLNGPNVAMPPLWPIAAAVGLVGNGIWFLCLGYMDFPGFVIGLTSAAISVGIEALCEHLGRGFVQGSAAAGWHPPASNNW